jgi:hypothetical protein
VSVEFEATGKTLQNSRQPDHRLLKRLGAKFIRFPAPQPKDSIAFLTYLPALTGKLPTRQDRTDRVSEP